MHHTQPPAEENQPQNIEDRASRVQQCVFALRVQFVNMDGFIPVRDEREFGDFPAGAGQGSVKIRTMLTSVAKSQARVVAKPPNTKFKTFRTVRINPQFLSI